MFAGTMPFAALGPALKAEMLALVAEIVAETGATLLMVSHDVADARAICDETISGGRGAWPMHRNRPRRFWTTRRRSLRAYLGEGAAGSGALPLWSLRDHSPQDI